ncbi:Hypothetical predicted protein [Paramuricea clavata]|uniref:Uncharacterized protein n=1 Tax=Paramuricea clavata TaxID=317549 RepID=A0A7D9DHR9_PARCT|nr:Hypothetical predicted protein [Paramuricea clavata]
MAVTCHTSFFALIGNTENPPFRPPKTYLFQACLSPDNLFKLLVMQRLIEEGGNREEGFKVLNNQDLQVVAELSGVLEAPDYFLSLELRTLFNDLLLEPENVQ